MKRLIVIILIVLAFASTNSYAQPKLIETVSRNGDELVIPYKKFMLNNGLTVIVHEDHSDPIVHVDVTYHVGSAREEIGKSGFAHFFEHMMFQGSDNVADEQHFKIITEAGGTLNGTTNQDRTNYFETVPSNQLEKMLWLEADRMGFLLDAVTQQKFEVQRATVKNERGQRYDNVPYGLVREVAAKNLYPYGHPYSWLTIGYIEDLNRVNVEDLKNFFLRWYGPNNAVLTIGGDVNTDDVIKLVEKYYGSIPRGPEVTKTVLPKVELKNDRYVSMLDEYAKMPLLQIQYPTVPNYHEDEAPLDCLAEILGQGRNSIFYKNLVKSQKAINANVSHPCSELAGQFSITVIPYPGNNLSDIEQMVNDALIEFEKRGVTDEDIEKFSNSNEASLINRLENVSGKVSTLASYHTFTGDANRIGKELIRNTSVTKEDVMRVYNKYVKGKHRLVLSVKTKKDPSNVAGPENYKVRNEDYKAPDYGYDGLKYVKAKDNFDRSKMPGNGPNPVVKVPDFWTKDLKGGIKVIGAKSDEIPVVTYLLEFKGGHMLEASNLDKVGVANMMADMLEEDTKNYTAEEYSVALDKLGSRINISASLDGINVTVRSLSKNIEKTMALLEERLLNPTFSEKAFERNKKRRIANLKNANVRGSYVASRVYDYVQFGKANLLAWPTSGTDVTVENITLEDVKNFYRDNMSINESKVVVVGDISEKDALKNLAFLQKIPSKKINLPKLPQVSAANETKIYFVDIPGSAQTQFRIGTTNDMRYNPLGKYYKAYITNYPLGGAFNCRLNLFLREDKGWTYGARAGFSANKYSGEYSFSAGIKADATDSALTSVIRIINEYRTGGMTADELVFTKSSLGQSEARKYESGYQKAGFLSRILDYNLPADYTTQQNKILASITLDEINKIKTSVLPSTSKVNIVLVGDKAKLWDRLSKLGYPIVELDANGNMIK